LSAQIPQETSSADLAPYSELLETFDRFYSVASFYPPDHSQCQTALRNFYQAMDKAVPTGESMTMEPVRGGLMLQGIFLNENHLGSSHISKLLNELGLAQLQINSQAPLGELHHMANTLNSLKLEASSFHKFHSLDFSNLPPSVKVLAKEFHQRQFETGSPANLADSLQQHLNQLMDQVQKQPWTETRKRKFRLKAEDFLARTVENLNSDPGRDIGAPISLEKIISTTSAVLEQALLNEIGSGFETEDQIVPTDDESLQQSDASEENNQPSSDSSEYSISVADLKAGVMKIAASAVDPSISPSDHCLEMIAICLEMLSSDLGGNHAQALAKNLRKLLALPIDPAKVAILEKSIVLLVETGDRTPVDQVLPRIIPHLLRNNSEGFARFLKSSLPADQPEKIAMIWPHLVAMMLMTKPPRNKTLQGYLLEAIASLPEERVQEEAHRLDFLEVVQSGKMGTSLLHWPLSKSHGALKALLSGRQSNQTGQRLHRIWLDKTPNRLTGVLMQILGSYEAMHQSYYSMLIDFSVTGELPIERRREVCQLIRESLGSLENSERDAVWVPSAMEELGHPDCPENQTFLEEVYTGKRAFVLYAWPGDSRKAAQSALESFSPGKGGSSS